MCWFISRSIDQSIYWLMIYPLIDWLVDLWIDDLLILSIDWLIGGSMEWLIYWSHNWLIDQSIYVLMIYWLYRLSDWLIYWFIDLLIEWKTDWLIECSIYLFIYFNLFSISLIYWCFGWPSACWVCSGQTQCSWPNDIRWSHSFTGPFLHVYAERPVGQGQRRGSGAGVWRPTRTCHVWDENDTAWRQLCRVLLHRIRRPRTL